MNKYVLVNRIVPTTAPEWKPSGYMQIIYIPYALVYWLITFVSGNYELEPRPLYRNVPEGADAPIDKLPGGTDPYIVQIGSPLPPTFVNEYGETVAHTLSTLEADIA
jgi:hypothetical protein